MLFLVRTGRARPTQADARREASHAPHEHEQITRIAVGFRAIAASPEELSYETALKALSTQENDLHQMRSRTGTLLAAASISASFLGAQTLGKSGTDPWAALGVVAFVLSILPCVYLLVPKRGLVFSLSGSVLYQQFPANTPLEDIYRELSEWLEVFWYENQEKIDDLNRYFLAASAALVAEIVFLALALRATI